MQSEDIVLQCRDENEAQLVKLLDKLGFGPLSSGESMKEGKLGLELN
jgi:hypothetical protein